MALISWKLSEANQGQHSLNSTARCDTSVYALAVALDEAKSWIDIRILEAWAVI